MTLTVVAAVASNGVIGRNNDLPWRLPADLRHFRELTLGTTVLMGRRTFDSIGKPLPGRSIVVLTRQPGWTHDGVTVVRSVADARRLFADRVVMLAGGGELYREFWADADRLEITHVHSAVDGDTTLPVIDPQVWSPTKRDDFPEFSWVTYERQSAGRGPTAEPS